MKNKSFLLVKRLFAYPNQIDLVFVILQIAENLRWFNELFVDLTYGLVKQIS